MPRSGGELLGSACHEIRSQLTCIDAHPALHFSRSDLALHLAADVAIQVARDVASEGYRWAPFAARSLADVFIHVFTRHA